MSPEESQLNFDQTTLAPRMLNQHSSTDKPEPTLLLCHFCEFQTNGSLRGHLEHHIKKFSQQCHLCSYSARKKEELVYHLTNHHSKRPLISESQKDEQAAGEPTRKRKYYHCGQCDYESTDRSYVNWHVHKRHPIAAKPSSRPSRKTRPFSKVSTAEIHKKNSAYKKASFRLHQCELCDYETNKKSNLNYHCQFHFKKSAYQCNRCSYSVSTAQKLNFHLENQHSERGQAESDLCKVLGESTLPRHESKRVKRHHGNEETISIYEEELEDLNSLLKCYECNFSTDSVAKMMFHKSCHSSTNCKHKCPLCTFSSSLRNVTFHWINHHGDDAAYLSSESEKVTTSVTSANVNLVPVKPQIKPSNFDAEEKSCREEIVLLEEALRSDRQTLENASIKLMEREEQMQSVRAQFEIAEEYVETTEKRLKDAQLRKNENEKQKREVVKKRMKTEFDLRTEQCKALELDLIAFDAVEEDPPENRVAAEKIVETLENQLGEILKELADLKEEGKTLSEDLGEAEACYLEAFQSLSIPQAELEALESDWKEDFNSLNQMVDSSKEKLEVYYQLEKQLLDEELQKKMEHLSQKKTNYLLSLKNLCDG